MHSGIDVSHHNGELDWDTIQEAGVEFAIIRLGYGNDDIRQDDTQAEYNMSECERLGIPFGCYLFSYAVSEEDARSEVNHALRMVEGHTPPLGIWYDVEDAPRYRIAGEMTDDMKENLTGYCQFFCDSMLCNGYQTGIYANKYYFSSVLNQGRISEYQKWLAHWDIDAPDMDCLIWQYSSQGKIAGAGSNTDLNIYYGQL